MRPDKLMFSTNKHSPAHQTKTNNSSDYKQICKNACSGTVFADLLCLPKVKTHLSKHVIVQGLKDFIETELAKALHGVTNECWSPPFAQTSKAILSQGHWEAIEDGLVLIRVHLEENRNNAFPKVWLQTQSKQVGHFFSFCTYSFNVTLEK